MSTPTLSIPLRRGAFLSLMATPRPMRSATHWVRSLPPPPIHTHPSYTFLSCYLPLFSSSLQAPFLSIRACASCSSPSTPLLLFSDLFYALAYQWVTPQACSTHTRLWRRFIPSGHRLALFRHRFLEVAMRLPYVHLTVTSIYNHLRLKLRDIYIRIYPHVVIVQNIYDTGDFISDIPPTPNPLAYATGPDTYPANLFDVPSCAVGPSFPAVCGSTGLGYVVSCQLCCSIGRSGR